MEAHVLGQTKHQKVLYVVVEGLTRTNQAGKAPVCRSSGSKQ